jgi:hypothetical protein
MNIDCSKSYHDIDWDERRSGKTTFLCCRVADVIESGEDVVCILPYWHWIQHIRETILLVLKQRALPYKYVTYGCHGTPEITVETDLGTRTISFVTGDPDRSPSEKLFGRGKEKVVDFRVEIR